MRISYNKLVRDRVPEIIREAGKQTVTEVAADGRYVRLLEAKLQEETAELLAPDARRLEELADLLEVVYALARVEGASPAELEAVRARKAAARGGFEDRVVLLEVIADGDEG